MEGRTGKWRGGGRWTNEGEGEERGWMRKGAGSGRRRRGARRGRGGELEEGVGGIGSRGNGKEGGRGEVKGSRYYSISHVRSGSKDTLPPSLPPSLLK